MFHVDRKKNLVAAEPKKPGFWYPESDELWKTYQKHKKAIDSVSDE
jgi:hypothetical protein